jgi:hypothetical protein
MTTYIPLLRGLYIQATENLPMHPTQTAVGTTLTKAFQSNVLLVPLNALLADKPCGIFQEIS